MYIEKLYDLLEISGMYGLIVTMSQEDVNPQWELSGILEKHFSRFELRIVDARCIELNANCSPKLRC